MEKLIPGRSEHVSETASVAKALRKLAHAMALLALSSCSGMPTREEPGVAASGADSVKKQAQRSPAGAPSLIKNAEASAEYHFSLAQAYVAEGNPDRAIEEYKITLMFDPNSSLVYARLATEYIKKGNLTAAMEACKEALQRDPNFTDARLILAGLYSTSRETQAALTEYEKVLKSDPKHEEAMVYKAQLLVDQGRSAEALKGLKAFLKRNPESTLAWYYTGRAEQHLDHFAEAVKAYRKALDLRPGFANPALALGYLYEEKGKTAEAIRAYKALYEETQDVTAANRIATILLKEEKYKEAVPYLESIETADSDDLNVRVKLGLVHMELKNYERAISLFKSILEKNPESDRIHYYLGSLYEQTQKTDLAIAELKQIQPDSKLFGDAALHVAYLLKNSERMDEAKASIADSIARSPKNPSFYIFQASLEEETKNPEEAVRILVATTRKFPEDEKVRYYLGSLYDRQGESDKGLAEMEQILKINPDNVDALNYIAYTWTVKGIRLTDAEKLLRRALKLRPGNGYIQDSWGWYLFVRGRVNEAVVELEKAARLEPSEPTILEHLGDAYLRSNLREKALQQYVDAVKYTEEAGAKEKLQTKVESLRTEIAGKRGKGREERAPAQQE